METFLVLKVLAQWALPPASMAVGLVIAGILALLRWRRLAWVAASVAVLKTLVLAWPPVSDALIRPLEREGLVSKRYKRLYRSIIIITKSQAGVVYNTQSTF